MTGGIGFTRWAQNNNLQNLNLLKKRKRQEDNPYSPTQLKYRRKPISHFKELMGWKVRKERKERRLKIVIILTIFLVFAFTVLILSL